MRKSVTDSETIAVIGFILVAIVIVVVWGVLSGILTFGTGIDINGVTFSPEMLVPGVALGVFLLLRGIAHRRPQTKPFIYIHRALAIVFLLVLAGAFGSWSNLLGVYYTQFGIPAMPFNALTASTFVWSLIVAIADFWEHHMREDAGKQTTPAADVPTGPLHPLPDSTEPPVFAAGEPQDHHVYGGRIVRHWDTLDAPPRHTGGIWEGERPARIARGTSTITLDDDTPPAPKD